MAISKKVDMRLKLFQKKSLRAGALIVFNCLCLAAILNHFQRKSWDCTARYRYECPMRLEDLWVLVTGEYERRGQYPSNLEFIAEQFQVKRWNVRTHIYPLLCPGTDTKMRRNGTAESWSDYIYVSPSVWSGNPAVDVDGFPMAYDQSTSNHGGRGVYVLTVEGRVFWDRGAEWLRRFAREHPEYKLRVP